jgi:hypothetical protein
MNRADALNNQARSRSLGSQKRVAAKRHKKRSVSIRAIAFVRPGLSLTSVADFFDSAFCAFCALSRLFPSCFGASGFIPELRLTAP